jgi:phosphoribosylanthranilate isomerase
MMNSQDVVSAEASGADAVGFVTEYPVPVPWNISRDQAAGLVRETSPFLTTVAVVGGPPDRMVRIARAVNPKVLQLHGDETLAQIGEVITGLEGTGIKVIKAMRVNVDTGKASFEETDPVKAAKILAGSGISALLVDSQTSSMPAGTGVALDWGMAAEITRLIDLPVILAGGLTARNAPVAVSKVKPYALDVISGVEKEPGIKDPGKMKAFVKATKGISIET